MVKLPACLPFARPVRRTLALLALALVLALNTSCGSSLDAPRAADPDVGELVDVPRGAPVDDEDGDLVDLPPAEPEQPIVEPGERLPPSGLGTLGTMRGDPRFEASGLSTNQRLWYDRTWDALDASVDEMISTIRRDNSNDYARTVFQYHHALLLALRASGDLRFLDAVDETAQAMRAQLRNRWCDGVDRTVWVNQVYGTVHERDGYLNFRYRRGPDVHYCRDTSDLDAALVHGHLALVMYAYHVNRDNPSPKGIDYGERADFWFDYLRNHFEAKWRERSRTAWPDMDFIDVKFCHTYNVFNLFYWFMGKKLESEGHPDAAAYLRHAQILTDAMFDQPYTPGSRGGGFIDTVGSYGDAVVYSFGAPRREEGVNDTHLGACPTTYARYTISAVTTLHFEGVARWDDTIMTKLANGMTSFVLDAPTITARDDTLAAGVTGSATVAGIPATTYRSRLSIGHYTHTTIPTLGIWDASGRIEAISMQIYEVREPNPARPSRVFIPASMLVVETASDDGLGLTARR